VTASFPDPLNDGPAAFGGGVLVVGLGRFGESVARGLVALDVEVLAVDADEEIVQRLAPEIPNIVQADATNARALRQIGGDQFPRAVVGIASNVEASVLATLAIKDELEIPTIWAKALSEPHAKILEALGVHRVIQPESEMGARVARGLARGVTDYIRIEDDYALVEIAAPRSLLGRPLGQTGIRSRYGVTIVSVKPPHGSFQHCDVDTVLVEGELILVAGRPENLDRLIRQA
jgi:trk system potassium uptake protein TrkA